MKKLFWLFSVCMVSIMTGGCLGSVGQTAVYVGDASIATSQALYGGSQVKTVRGDEFQKMYDQRMNGSVFGTGYVYDGHKGKYHYMRKVKCFNSMGMMRSNTLEVYRCHADALPIYFPTQVETVESKDFIRMCQEPNVIVKDRECRYLYEGRKGNYHYILVKVKTPPTSTVIYTSGWKVDKAYRCHVNNLPKDFLTTLQPKTSEQVLNQYNNADVVENGKLEARSVMLKEVPSFFRDEKLEKWGEDITAPLEDDEEAKLRQRKEELQRKLDELNKQGEATE